MMTYPGRAHARPAAAERGDGAPRATAWGSGRSPVWKKARTCAPRRRGVGRWGPTSVGVGFGAQPRLEKARSPV